MFRQRWLFGGDTNDGARRVRRAGRERERVLFAIRGLDTKHLRPLVVAKIRHRFRFRNPRIPDDRRVRATLLDADAALPRGVVDDAGGLCV